LWAEPVTVWGSLTVMTESDEKNQVQPSLTDGGKKRAAELGRQIVRGKKKGGGKERETWGPHGLRSRRATNRTKGRKKKKKGGPETKKGNEAGKEKGE